MSSQVYQCVQEISDTQANEQQLTDMPTQGMCVIPHQPPALGGHISSILYIKWTKTVISDMYDKVNNTRNHCILNVCYSIHPYIGEIISLNIKSNHAHFHSRKYIRKCRLQNGHHVVWARSVFVYVQFIAAQQECLFNTMLKLMQKRQSSVLLSLCEENPSVTSEFPSQRSTKVNKGHSLD